MNRIAIIGGGGHGRVIASILREIDILNGTKDFAGFIERGTGEIDEAPILGGDEDLLMLKTQGVIGRFIVGLGSVKGGTKTRDSLFEQAQSAGLTPAIAVHPLALVAHNVKIGDGTVIMPGAIINIGGCVGENSIINTGTILDHDAQVGRNVHIAPGCTLSGNVSVGDHTLVGVGSTIRHGIKIGSCVTIGAGSVIVKPLLDNVTVFGNPAKMK